jgi:heme exporter protein CcmD
MLKTWLGMGGYGAYVWAAYGIALVLLVGFLIYSLQQRRQAVALIDYDQ